MKSLLALLLLAGLTIQAPLNPLARYSSGSTSRFIRNLPDFPSLSVQCLISLVTHTPETLQCAQRVKSDLMSKMARNELGNDRNSCHRIISAYQACYDVLEGECKPVEVTKVKQYYKDVFKYTLRHFEVDHLIDCGEDSSENELETELVTARTTAPRLTERSWYDYYEQK